MFKPIAVLKDDILQAYKDLCQILSREYDEVPKDSAEQNEVARKDCKSLEKWLGELFDANPKR